MPNVISGGRRNEEWHAKHPAPVHPTLDQKIARHMEHARRCPCPEHDPEIMDELKKRYVGKHQDFWILYHTDDHRNLGRWAADCAERLLPWFENKIPDDPRPREAIHILRQWADTGVFRMSVIRGASLGAHAAAREVKARDPAAAFAAHGTGQAVATAHAPTHAFGAVMYSIKLIAHVNPGNVKAAVAKERGWQNRRLPSNLRPWADGWTRKLQRQLPKLIREELE